MDDGACPVTDVSIYKGYGGADCMSGAPFLSSIVTVSLAHFIRNLFSGKGGKVSSDPEISRQAYRGKMEYVRCARSFS